MSLKFGTELISGANSFAKKLTKAEYEQEKATNPDFNDTIYFITDDEIVQEDIIARLYPIGSIVMGDNLTDELIVKAIYGGNSWQAIIGTVYGVGTTTRGQVFELGIIDEQLPKLTTEGGEHKHLWKGWWRSGTTDGKPVTSRYENSGDPEDARTRTDGEHTHNIVDSAGVQKDGGHVQTAGIVTYCWKRVS